MRFVCRSFPVTMLGQMAGSFVGGGSGSRKGAKSTRPRNQSHYTRFQQPIPPNHPQTTHGRTPPLYPNGIKIIKATQVLTQTSESREHRTSGILSNSKKERNEMGPAQKRKVVCLEEERRRRKEEYRERRDIVLISVAQPGS